MIISIVDTSWQKKNLGKPQEEIKNAMSMLGVTVKPCYLKTEKNEFRQWYRVIHLYNL